MSDQPSRYYTSSESSFQTMAPITRSRARAILAAASPEPSGSIEDEDVDVDLESDSGMSGYDTDECPSVVRSPTNLLYSLENLSRTTQAAVAAAMRDPPVMVLEHCRRIDQTYAFQMKELVTRSIRIRAPGSAGSPFVCSCQASTEASPIEEHDSEEDVDMDSCSHHCSRHCPRPSPRPCPHSVWLLDQLLKEMLYDHDENTKLTMLPGGYAQEMGDPFSSIASYHLSTLAPGLHCPLIDPEAGYDAAADPTRVLEAREILSAYHSVPPEEFRPDIFADPPVMASTASPDHDLDQTIFGALVENHFFFQHLLSQAGSIDSVRDPFRKLSQRIDRVLCDLDAYTACPADMKWSLETPSNVPWAASHIVGSVNMIRTIIFHREQPLLHVAATSAAATLIHILEAVVSRNVDVPVLGRARRDRNLYLRLIGDRDQSFVIDILDLLPEAARQFVHRLDALLERISIHGAPLSYVEKFRTLLQRLRATRSTMT